MAYIRGVKGVETTLLDKRVLPNSMGFHRIYGFDLLLESSSMLRVLVSHSSGFFTGVLDRDFSWGALPATRLVG